MKVDAFAGNILMGIGFVACMIWYVSSALKTWFGRAELEAAMGSRLIRAVLLVSRSRIASSKSNAMYILTSSIITGFPLVFAVLSGGRARIIALAFALVCLAIAGYGFVVMRRIRAARDH